MAVSYTTTDLLSSIRMIGSIPSTTNTSNVNSTANLLTLATNEMLIKLLPLIMATREEFYVTSKDFSITANQSDIQIPYRAVGQIVRDLHVIQGTGIYRLHPVEREFVVTTTTGSPASYYFRNNYVVLYPTPGAGVTGTVRMGYFQRPSQLEQTANCAQVTAVNTSTNTVTVNAVPSKFSTSTPLDFIRAAPPYDNQATDLTPTAISGSSITFSALPTDQLGNVTVAVNDWLALSEYTPIPQIPREFQTVLAQMTAIKVLQAQGDIQGAQVAIGDLKVLQENALSLITQRNEGENHKIISRNWYRR